MKTAQYWIDQLALKLHPEGGFYKETYRSTERIAANELPQRFTGTRNFCTAIYFLLRSQDRSLLHRIKSDELWHYHAGTSLSIYIFDNNSVSVQVLGSEIEKGESLQIMVPANCWFGARVRQPDSYTLCSCTVAPGFDFQDFEMAKRDVLLEQFKDHRDVIEMLTV